MTLDDAMEGQEVSGSEALRELRRHQFEAVMQDGELLILDEVHTGGDDGRWAKQWVRCELNSRAVLEFLNY